ncbi:unnamed protein product [Rhizophagus irregularis]|nr:unnamed protein product [Rhizophagus irregularis]
MIRKNSCEGKIHIRLIVKNTSNKTKTPQHKNHKKTTTSNTPSPKTQKNVIACVLRFLKLFGVNHSVLCWRQSVRQSCSRIDSRFFINIFEAKTDWPKLRMNG